MISEAAVALPSGQVISESQFYSARDHRTSISVQYAKQEFKIAIALDHGLESTVQGQAALVWTASMIRRMGKPFARLIIATAESAKRQLSKLALRSQDGQNLGQLVEAELRGADPFASYEWRDVDSADALEGADFVIWLGYASNGLRGRPGVMLQGCGATLVLDRIVAMESPPSIEGRIDRTKLSAIIFGTALAVAAAYEFAQGIAPEEPSRSWLSLTQSAITEDAVMGRAMIASENGSIHDAPADATAALRSNLVLISAGGIGMNVAHLLAEMRVQLEHATAIDHDQVELSGLNRLIGVGLEQLGQNKAVSATGALRNGGVSADAIRTTYEDWSNTNHTVLENEHTIAIVGVDQVGTRLHVQSDWPPIIINGSTGGTFLTVSTHFFGVDGCIGCLYADDKRPYNTTRRAAGCAAGLAPLPGAVTPTAEASYPFVSVGVAALIAHTFGEITNGREELRGRLSLNVLKPSLLHSDTIARNGDCLLLCTDETLTGFFNPNTEESIPPVERASH
jgi:molybdopterin/thiamine biosynthesis adenylyltransferase